MERTRALMKLLEAADLIGMVEELSAPGREQASPLTRAGLRITLKNVRDSILASHDALAAEFVAGGALRSDSAENMAAPGTPNARTGPVDSGGAKLPPPLGTRRDLRSTIERFVDSGEP